MDGEGLRAKCCDCLGTVRAKDSSWIWQEFVSTLVRSKSHFSRVEGRRALERIIGEQMDQLENSSPRCHVMGMELEGTGGHWRAPPPSSPRARVIPDNEWAPLLLCKILREGGTKQARVHAGV